MRERGMKGMQRFEVKGRLPGMNDLTNESRTHPKAGARLKRKAQETVEWAIKAAHLRPMKAPVHVRITFIEPNMRRDKDNISSGGRKVILDALVKMGVIGNDNWHWIGGKEDSGLSETFKVNKAKPRVVVEVIQL